MALGNGKLSQKVLGFFIVSHCTRLALQWLQLDSISPSDAMPSTRPNLTRPNLILDEQSFQSLLAAAFTIQEHNDLMKRAEQGPATTDVEQESERDTGRESGSDAERKAEASSICPHCGALKSEEATRCESCGREQYRPGERLQRNWASMWMMSKEQGLWREPPAEVDEATPGIGKAARQNSKDSDEELAAEELDLANPDRANPDCVVEALQLSASDDHDTSHHDANFWQGLADFRAKLLFHRADVYLGAAVLVAVLALLWPAARAPRRAALSPMQRLLVTVGLAEVPAPAVHLQGDPGIQVWVDPHTALYYCPGEEQYGKTADGRFGTQREAQIDRFEPAARSVCE
jgi:ribosomal protein L40E